MGSYSFIGVRLQFCSVKKFQTLELCIVTTYLTYTEHNRAAHVKMVKMVNFMLCVLTTIQKVNKDLEDLHDATARLDLTFTQNTPRLKQTHAFQEHRKKHFS